MPPHLCPEIWIQVFHFLRNPLPRPHAEKRPDSSEIRQPGLFAALRVSRTWYNLSTPLLYQTVVTDRLLDLLRGIDDPAIPGIIPKLQLLAETTSLFIEYDCRMPVDYRIPVAPWTGLLSPSQICQELMRDGEPGSKHDFRAIKEGRSLLTALEVVMYDEDRYEQVFPRLKTLSIGAFMLGHGDRSRWIDAELFSSWSSGLLYQLRDALRDFIFNHTPALEHYCETGEGPLTVWDRWGNPSFSGKELLTFSFHSNGANDHTGASGRCFPVIIGGPSRWYIHSTIMHPLPLWNGAQPKSVLDDCVTSLTRMLQVRVDYPKTPTLAGINLWRITGDLYLRFCGDGAKSLGEYRDRLERILLLPEYRDGLPDWSKSAPADEWEVKDLDVDAPDCEACGWSVKQ